jgi:UDP:flavonoid glycosyltransferase YjiC (YdhE family)
VKIVLTSVGSRGDVQPMVAIAQALVRRGHRVVIAAPPDFGPWIESFGFEAVGMGSDVNAFLQRLREVLGANIARFFSLTRDLFDKELPAQMDTLVDIARDADAIVFGGGSAMAPSAGEKLGIPVIGVLFTTCVIPSSDHAPVVVPWRTLPRWMNALLWKLESPMWNVLLRRGVNAGRARHGLTPVRDMVTYLFERSHYMAGVDDAVLPLSPEWRARIPPVGFLLLDASDAALEPDLESWLDAGEPPVYVGFGSMTGRGPERMKRIVVDAIGSLGRRALVSRGWANLGEGVPEGWRVIGEVPHEKLFPRMACVIHHGGSGTTASALRAGVPQVLVPLILDQYHHAQVLYEQGLTPRPVPMEKITAPQLGNAIRDALALPREKREAVARRLRASRGADAIVDRIEAAAAGR